MSRHKRITPRSTCRRVSRCASAKQPRPFAHNSPPATRHTLIERVPGLAHRNTPSDKSHRTHRAHCPGRVPASRLTAAPTAPAHPSPAPSQRPKKLPNAPHPTRTAAASLLPAACVSTLRPVLPSPFGAAHPAYGHMPPRGEPLSATAQIAFGRFSAGLQRAPARTAAGDGDGDVAVRAAVLSQTTTTISDDASRRVRQRTSLTRRAVSHVRTCHACRAPTAARTPIVWTLPCARRPMGVRAMVRRRGGAAGGKSRRRGASRCFRCARPRFRRRGPSFILCGSARPVRGGGRRAERGRSGPAVRRLQRAASCVCEQRADARLAMPQHPTWPAAIAAPNRPRSVAVRRLLLVFSRLLAPSRAPSVALEPRSPRHRPPIDCQSAHRAHIALHRRGICAPSQHRRPSTTARAHAVRTRPSGNAAGRAHRLPRARRRPAPEPTPCRALNEKKNKGKAGEKAAKKLEKGRGKRENGSGAALAGHEGGHAVRGGAASSHGDGDGDETKFLGEENLGWLDDARACHVDTCYCTGRYESCSVERNNPARLHFLVCPAAARESRFNVAAKRIKRAAADFGRSHSNPAAGGVQQLSGCTTLGPAEPFPAVVSRALCPVVARPRELEHPRVESQPAFIVSSRKMKRETNENVTR